MEDKITRIELQLDKHSIQIAKLFSKIDDTNGCIVKINNSLLQIKYGVYGALGFYIITQVGILEALKIV
jgi:phosphotransferase system IIB component|tara:strand:- start:208 stop:414 length:207 start_codon:yes stop_codon:yes gene_type:complete